MIKRALIFIHRWLGVALCALFLLWFPSGIVMMYWSFPEVTPADRLARSHALDASAVVLSPAEASAKAGIEPSPRVRLNTFDGRPVYRFAGRGGEHVVFADTGEARGEMSRSDLDRLASAWTGQPAASAAITPVEEVDQWTVQGVLRNARPLWKYAWPNGEQVYISGLTGEVVQYTTRASRVAAYLGAIPHWFYFTPLRTHQIGWSRTVIWSSAAGSFTALIGVVVGLWVYSPFRRYRIDGRVTSIPYRGMKRWHAMIGLVFGVATVTWTFSGMLSMEPFPLSSTPPPAQRPVNMTGILRGRFDIDAFAAKTPRVALEQLRGRDVKELELSAFAGEPFYLATLAEGGTEVVPLAGEPLPGIGVERIVEAVKKGVPAGITVDAQVIDQYDRYYLDRNRERPLPAILIRVNDATHSRYYIDPKTARLAGSYNDTSWIGRWLYNGLHSFNFPWLYNYRPLWDIVVIAFMLGGTALSLTSLVLVWQVIGRALRRA